jgi:hypothetical protein
LLEEVVNFQLWSQSYDGCIYNTTVDLLCSRREHVMISVNYQTTICLIFRHYKTCTYVCR